MSQSELEQQLDDLTEKLSHSYEELSLVYTLGEQMSVTRPVDGYLACACDAVIDTLGVRGVGVLAWDEFLGDARRCLRGDLDFSEEDLNRLAQDLKQIFNAEIEAGGGDVFLRTNDVSSHAQVAWLSGRVTQLLAVPMRRGGRAVGCCFAIDKDVPPEIFGRFNDGAFTSIDRKLLAGAAVNVAIFLENRRLFDDSERLMMGLLHALVAAVDAKDEYTRGHSVRVALFAKRLAEEAGYDAAFADRVYLSGLLHDVGKIGVEDRVIRKPGKLDDEEFEQIKRHPEIGHRILRRVPGIDDILPGVLHHHEKVNGRGYPHGLTGEDIPLLGRLMCIADSFDAMTSSRTYRSAMPIEAALAEVQRCAGTQFDAALAETFCSIPRDDFAAMVRLERDGGLAGIAVPAARHAA